MNYLFLVADALKVKETPATSTVNEEDYYIVLDEIDDDVDLASASDHTAARHAEVCKSVSSFIRCHGQFVVFRSGRELHRM
jgi:hypothetical protein